jgi:hypothetical protein
VVGGGGRCWLYPVLWSWRWLKKNGARSSAAVAAAALEAAKSQHTIVPAQHMGEEIVAALAREILTLNEELAELDALISAKVTELKSGI